MSTTPWLTSSDLIAAVKRKIAIPINQRTFSEDDVLAFCNEETLISQVPDILLYHQEYFVFSEDIPLVVNQLRYPIPERAMGTKLRDIFYVDDNGNLFETTRLNPDDKSYWQRESSTNNLMQKYYLEGNDVVLAPLTLSQVTGSLRFSYFLRPNQLVQNNRAAVVDAFFKNLTVTNASLVAGDTIDIGDLTFTAVAGAPAALEYQIAGTSVLTAANLVVAINLDATYFASSGSSNIVTVFYAILSTSFISSNIAGITVDTRVGVRVPDGVPTNITSGSLVDLLQTRSGHRLYAKDVLLALNSVSTDAILFAAGVIPSNFVVGDYICNQYECIIPQIPTDLHSGLAERAASRILAAQGDMQGLQISQAKIADIKHSEGILSENRVEGSTQKVNQRKSPLSFQRLGIRRRV